MARASVSADSSILTRILLAEIPLDLTVPSHPSRLAVTFVVINQLHAVASSFAVTRVGQAFIDVSFASLSGKSRNALAFVSSYFVETMTPMMTSSFVAFIEILLAQLSDSSRRAGAGEIVDKIIAGSSISARIRSTIVDIVFALSSLESWRTGTAEVSLQIVACCAVVAGIAGASV